MATREKLFAFRLADRLAIAADRNDGKWKARDGIASAQFCTEPIAAVRHLPDAAGADSSLVCV